MTTNNLYTPPPFTCPAVSVIIPMYNAEKYIAECIESILAQTFQNFEVIIVDDCSTDSSCAIVESYRERFGGRLTLDCLEKNSGGPGHPRNKGLMISRGEYVFFMDADDFLDKIALEKLYTLAKNFDVDVVYTGTAYSYKSDKGAELTFDTKRKFLFEQRIEDKPILTLNSPEKNLEQLFVHGNLFFSPWAKLIRRDLLTKNEILFPNTHVCQDTVWTLDLFVCAKKILQIPDAVYFYRTDVMTSLTRDIIPHDKEVFKWSKEFIDDAKALYDLANKREFLKKNPVWIYYTLYNVFGFCQNRMTKAICQLNSLEVYEILQRGFAADSNAFAMSFLFSVIDAQQKNLILAQQHSAQLEAELKRLKS